MTKPDPSTVDSIYCGALGLSGDQRAAYIDKRCRDDEVLKQKVCRLVAGAEFAGQAFSQRFSEVCDRLWRVVIENDVETGEDLSGQRINAWRIDRRLARGGLATVYLAHRDDGQYEQQVAFKVLRRGLDTDDLIARFRVERQILSSLEHPTIARILDGGALEDGRPFLVLEYVDGMPITSYCDANQVSVACRIRLMITVLRALQHAHSHLIVHRDVKPTNIMVSNEGRVSLLDFGIAKLLDPDTMPGASTLTRTGMSLLTPGYGSPEQLAGRAVTTASDIYQAGAVLFELLTGHRPQPGTKAAKPTSPPTRKPGSPGIRPSSAIRGDLNAVVNKAMHVDPLQRYVSAAEMEADLQRYLDGRPVIAGPDSWRYRFGKFVHRRPWALPIATVAALAMIAYVVTLSQYNRQLLIEQHRAAAAQSFLVNLLGSADPFRPADPDLGSDITVVEALDIGVKRLETTQIEDPELRASLLSSIASVYGSLDENRTAIALGQEVLALQRKIYGDQSEPAAATVAMLAAQYNAVNDFPKARALYVEQLQIAKNLYPKGDPEIGAAEAAFGEFLAARGNTETARDLLESALVSLRKRAEENSGPLIRALIALAALESASSRERTLDLLSEARALAEGIYGQDSLQAALVYTQTGTSMSTFGDYDRAQESFLAAKEIYEARVGLDHGATLAALNNLGIVYGRIGDFARAEQVHRDILERLIAKYGTAHSGVAGSYQNMATMIGRQGRFAEAIPLHRKALESYRTVMTDDNYVMALPLLSIAYASLQLDEFAQAEGAAREALDILHRTVPDSYVVGVAQCLIGLSIEARDGMPGAQSMLEKARERLSNSAVLEPYRSLCSGSPQAKIRPDHSESVPDGGPDAAFTL